MKSWLLRFIKPSKLTEKIWKLDLEDGSVWPPPYQMSVGEPVRRLFLDLSPGDQQECQSSMKCFFMAGTKAERVFAVWQQFLGRLSDAWSVSPRTSQLRQMGQNSHAVSSQCVCWQRLAAWKSKLACTRLYWKLQLMTASLQHPRILEACLWKQ